MPSDDIEVRELSCELSETELLQRGDAMAEAELLIEQLKAERAGVSEQIKDQQVLRRKLAGVIDSGVERRDVRCAWIEDFPKNVYRLIRQDTGEEVDTCAMTADDRQLAMGEVGEPKQAEETIDLDDEIPEDDEDLDELEDETPEPKPAPEPVKTRGRGRGRQQQPTA